MSSHKRSKHSIDKVEPTIILDANVNENINDTDNNNNYSNIENDNINTNNNTNGTNTNPLDINQLSNLFNNMDLNQLSGLLNNIDIGQLSSLFGGLIGGGGIGNNNENTAFKFTNDKRVDILNAVKPLVAPQRATLIDVVLQVYTISKILKK